MLLLVAALVAVRTLLDVAVATDERGLIRTVDDDSDVVLSLFFVSFCRRCVAADGTLLLRYCGALLRLCFCGCCFLLALDREYS